MVIDYTQLDERARIYPAELVYQQTGARDFKRYTLAEAVALARAADHPGPWQSKPDDPEPPA